MADKASKTRAPKVVLPFGDSVRTAIDAGDVLLDEGIVNVGNVEVPYDRLTAVTLAGARAMVADKVDLEFEEKDGEKTVKRGTTLCGEFTYGFDLSRRAKVRQQYEQAAEGPAKALDRAVADLMKIGYSEDDAKRIAAAAPAAQK